MAKKGVPVEGTCKHCGHVTRTRSEPGRLTWKGDCPQCGGKGLYCKRIPKPAGDTTPEDAGSSTSGEQLGAMTVIDVESYDDERPGFDDTPDAERGPHDGPGPDVDDGSGADVDDDELEEGEGDPPEVPAAGDEGTGSAGSERDDDEPTEPGPRRRRRRRWARRDATAGELIPGIYR
jgi:hypothetical protein